jgi:hypothetical protein
MKKTNVNKTHQLIPGIGNAILGLMEPHSVIKVCFCFKFSAKVLLAAALNSSTDIYFSPHLVEFYDIYGFDQNLEIGIETFLKKKIFGRFNKNFFFGNLHILCNKLECLIVASVLLWLAA